MKNRIRKIRKELDITQQVFADRLGVSRNNIAGYETGKSEPGDAVVSLICREFNINEEWLRTGEGEMFNEMDSVDITMNHFGYIIGNGSAQKKAVLSALVEMVYYVPDEKWDYIFDQFERCLKEARDSKEPRED